MGAAIADGTGLGVGRPLPARSRRGGEKRFTPSPFSPRLPACLPPTHWEARSLFAAVKTSRASAAATVPLGPGCSALSTGLGSVAGRGVQGRGMVRWRRPALPGDAERVCVCVRVRHHAPPTSAWKGPHTYPTPDCHHLEQN